MAPYIMNFKNFKLKVVFKKTLVNNIILLGTTPSEYIDFIAGQYISFKVMDKVNRSYSIASSPDEEIIEFLVDISPNGPGSILVDSLNVGSEFDAMGPFGFFNLISTKALVNNAPIAFVATGTGIAPIRSMIKWLLNRHESREVHLYFGLRMEEMEYFFEEFDELSKKYINFKFIPVFSRPSDNWKGKIGHCQDIIKEDKLDASTQFYVCGRSDNVKSIVENLMALNYPRENIFNEKFG